MESYIYKAEYGNSILLFLFGSFIGIVMMALISFCLEKYWHGVITGLSSGTILMLGFQSYFFHVLTSVVVRAGIYKYSWAFDILTLLGSFVIVMAFYPVIILTKLYLPILVGKRK